MNAIADPMAPFSEPADISVIIPAYNGDRFLADTLDSVLQQTVNRLELIIIDDGSTDQTRQVVETYLTQGERIDACCVMSSRSILTVQGRWRRMQYQHQTNQGVAAARNRGLALAQGEFIAFLDQDDYWTPTKLADQINCFAAHPGVGIIHSGWQRVRQDGSPIVDVTPWVNVPRLDGHGWLLWMPILLSAMLFRRSWLEKVGPFDPHFIQACDVDLIQRLVVLECPTRWLPTITTFYRQHDRNESANTALQVRESWAVRDAFFQRPDLPPVLRAREADYRYHTLLWMAWRLGVDHQYAAAVARLKESLAYAQRSPQHTLLTWVNALNQMSLEHGYPSPTGALLQTPDWQQLVHDIMGPS